VLSNREKSHSDDKFSINSLDDDGGIPVIHGKKTTTCENSADEFTHANARPLLLSREEAPSDDKASAHPLALDGGFPATEGTKTTTYESSADDLNNAETYRRPSDEYLSKKPLLNQPNTAIYL
jgi:hypothetical protein